MNLLLSKHAGKTNHGDNKLMVRARRNFLDKGYYEPLCSQLCRLVTKLSPDEPVILDAGCGEGYYTLAAASSLDKSGKSADIYGIDVSRDAVDYAARRSSTINYAVASVFHIPVADCSCDMLITLFVPYSGEEYRRVLKKGGVMIMGIPSENHLWELKKAVYDVPYKNEVRPYELDGFSFAGSRRVSYKMKLTSNEDILSLFSMTPYYYKTGKDGPERLSRYETLETQADFELLVYHKI